MTILEVCVDSIASAVAAFEGGADRIELCSALSEGGLTPTAGMLKVLKSMPIPIPIFCMLRPRRGNDFNYSNSEIDSILYDMEALSAHGCDGFVFGALDNEQNVATAQCARVIRKAANRPVTFHRAFDITNPQDMHSTVQIVKELGFKRILTSGFKSSCDLGLDRIRELSQEHQGIVIMPGSGICPANVQRIISETNCKEFHASAKKRVSLLNDKTNSIAMGSGEVESESLYVTDASIVRELVEKAKDIKNK